MPEYRTDEPLTVSAAVIHERPEALVILCRQDHRKSWQVWGATHCCRETAEADGSRLADAGFHWKIVPLKSIQ